MSNDSDFLEERDLEEAKAAEKQSQINEHGLRYDGSKVGRQPWANSPGIYCVKPEVYYTCNKKAWLDSNGAYGSRAVSSISSLMLASSSSNSAQRPAKSSPAKSPALSLALMRG